MTAEILIAIAALCNDNTGDTKYCKTRLIECVEASETQNADTLAGCYHDSVFKGKWDSDKKTTVEDKK